MSYRWIEHTADLELELDAEDERGVFASAVEAFAELLASDVEGPEVTHELRLESGERAGLLVELLEEIVYLADTARFAPSELVDIDIGGRRAVVRGRTSDPPPLVKAVTYHGLEFRAVGGRWRARVVLDV